MSPATKQTADVHKHCRVDISLMFDVHRVHLVNGVVGVTKLRTLAVNDPANTCNEPLWSERWGLQNNTLEVFPVSFTRWKSPLCLRSRMIVESILVCLSYLALPMNRVGEQAACLSYLAL